MKAATPRYSHEEFASRGETIYERSIHSLMTAEDEGKFIAIDIDTGAYEMDWDDYTAVERLRLRFPNAQSWLVRVGVTTAYRIGVDRSGGVD